MHDYYLEAVKMAPGEAECIGAVPDSALQEETDHA